MNAAPDLASRRVRTAASLKWAPHAVALARCIDDPVVFGDVRAWAFEWTPFAAQRFAQWAAVLVGLFVPPKVAARQRAVRALSLNPTLAHAVRSLCR